MHNSWSIISLVYLLVSVDISTLFLLLSLLRTLRRSSSSLLLSAFLRRMSPRPTLTSGCRGGLIPCLLIRTAYALIILVSTMRLVVRKWTILLGTRRQYQHLTSWDEAM